MKLEEDLTSGQTASDVIPTNDSATTSNTTTDPDLVPSINITEKDLFDLIMEANKEKKQHCPTDAWVPAGEGPRSRSKVYSNRRVTCSTPYGEEKWCFIPSDIAVFLEGGDINYKHSRSATQCPGCLWKKSANGTVQVPFTFHPVYTNFERSLVSEVMKEFEVMTCVKFVSRTTEVDYLAIESAGGCWSYVGKVGGKQTVSIGMPACIKYNLIQHELMHTLGFFHEQTRNDRDLYIKILWENIDPSDYVNFNLDGGNTLNLTYGYNSIMHYGSKDYSKVSGKPSMIAKSDPEKTLGQIIGMHDVDVVKINTVYNCNLCRRKFVDETGTFSYNSKSSSQGASSCLYLIQTALKVLLEISDLNIPSSPGCNNSYIKVYDGVSQSSPVLLDKTCGKVSVPPLVSSESFMLIEIVNNQSSALSRFNASYQTVRYGGTFVTNDTLVESPDFPSMYPTNVDVVYSIIAPKGYKVSLTYIFFWLQQSKSCSKEFLKIYDEPLKASTPRTYCGSIYPPPPAIVSTGNIMVLQFHSGAIMFLNGFRAQIKFVK